MKVEFTYEVTVTCDEDDGIRVEEALTNAAKEIGSNVSVNETDAIEIEDED